MTKEHTLYNAESKIEADGDNVCVSFVTDAKRFYINYAISDIKSGNFPHVGITAREGLAILYKSYSECVETNYKNIWMPVDLLAKDYHVSVNMSHMIENGQKYVILIYGPILAHLEKISVEVNENDYFYIESMQSGLKKILFLGGAKTFGIGVTSTAMMFSNIVRRNNRIKADRISYNQKNFLKNISGYLDNIDLNYDIIVLELDGLGQDFQIIEECLAKILHRICKSGTVILWHALPYTDLEKKKLFSKIFESEIMPDNNYVYLNLDLIFSKDYRDMCTYSVNFINDAGNVLIYQSLDQEIQRWLWNI